MIAYTAPARPPAFIASVCGTHKGEDDHAFTPGEGWPTFRMLAASKQTALVALMFNTHNLLVTHGIAPVSYSPPPPLVLHACQQAAQKTCQRHKCVMRT